MGEEHKFNQAPEDYIVNYNRDKDNYQRKKKGADGALTLQKFM